MYWWSWEIAQLRNICVEARRQYRRVQKVQEEEDRLYHVYVEARTQLQEEIGRVKGESHDQMIAGLDQDPFGTPYRMVLGKLRAWAPPLTQTLQPDVLRGVLSSLFPQRANFAPPSMARPAAREEEEGVAPPVEEEELEEAVRRSRHKSTAPGLTPFPAGR